MKKVLLVVLLSGCAAKGPSPEDAMKAGVLDAAVAQAKAPLFEMTCSPSCTFASLKVGHPNGAAQLSEVIRVVMTPQPSEASQNFRAFVGVLGQVGNTAAIGHFASSIFGKMVGGYTAGFDANVKIAQSGFDSNAKAYDALRDALMKPDAVQPTQPAPLPTYALNGTFQNVLLGGGTQSNFSNSHNNPNPLVCALFPTTLGCRS